MATSLTTDRLRELAAHRAEPGQVLSLFLNLDPTDFATAEARSSAITSLLDGADRMVRERDGITHDEKVALEADLERLRTFFAEDFDAKGAHGLAIFASGPSDLWNVVKLDSPIESGVWLDNGPYLEPLAGSAHIPTFTCVLTNRRVARLFRGDAQRLVAIGELRSDTRGHHDQGGWSQARFQRAVEKDAHDHLKDVADELFERHKKRPIEHLLVAAPEGTYEEFVSHLHPYLAERLRGRFECDVENTGADEVRDAMAPLVTEFERAEEAALLDRLREGIGSGGRATGGLEDTLDALNQARVEALLFDHGFAVPGVCCPQCGFLGPAERAECPVDGTPLDDEDDIIPRAIERALEQSARVVVLRHHDDLGPLGSVAAVLRF